MRLGSLLILLFVICCGCSKDNRSSEASRTDGKESTIAVDDRLLTYMPVFVPVADGTVYAATNFGGDNPQLLWLVGKKTVAVDAPDLEPSALSYAAADLHGGLYVRGPTSLWYIKDGRALETTEALANDIRPEEHVVTRQSQRWAVTRQAAQRLHADTYDDGWDAGWSEGETQGYYQGIEDGHDDRD